MSKRPRLSKAEMVDRTESAQCDAPTVTVSGFIEGNTWGFWGKGRAVTVSGLSDGRFMVLVFKPHPMTLVKEAIVDQPPRTVAQAIAFAEGQ